MRKKFKLSGVAGLLLVTLGIAFLPAMSTHAACPADIISYWKLDEPGGSTYGDFVGRNDGEGNADPTPFADGRVNGAQQFNGSSTGINVPASHTFGWLGDASFSIELWVKTDGTLPGSGSANNQVLIGRTEGAMQWWVGLANTTGNASLFMTDGSGVFADMRGVGKSLSSGNWHHVVAVRDGNQNMLYVDGEAQGVGTTSVFADGFSASTDLTMGHLENAFRFRGLLDEVALYDRALSGTEIVEHYTAGLAGNGVASLRPAPVADAGVDQINIKGGTQVTLNGSGSTPGYPGAPISNYLWVQTAGTPVTLNGADSATPTFAAPIVGASGATLTFQLTVTAQDGQSASDAVGVGVVDRVPPVANAGPDQEVTAGDAVTLNGNDSSDADGTIVSYQWVQTAGTPVTLTGASSATPAFTAPAVDAAASPEVLTFQLTVTDNDGLSHSDDVNVTVNAGSTPAPPAPSGGGGGGGCFINSMF